jgi:hypothetical protein
MAEKFEQTIPKGMQRRLPICISIGACCLLLFQVFYIHADCNYLVSGLDEPPRELVGGHLLMLAARAQHHALHACVALSLLFGICALSQCSLHHRIFFLQLLYI